MELSLLFPFENYFYLTMSIIMAVAIVLDVNDYIRGTKPWDSYVDMFFWSVVLFCVSLYVWPGAIVMSCIGSFVRWCRNPNNWKVQG